MHTSSVLFLRPNSNNLRDRDAAGGRVLGFAVRRHRRPDRPALSAAREDKEDNEAVGVGVDGGGGRGADDIRRGADCVLQGLRALRRGAHAAGVGRHGPREAADPPQGRRGRRHRRHRHIRLSRRAGLRV